MPPPDQRFAGGDAAALQIDDRLVDEVKFVVLKSESQIGLETAPLQQFLLVFGSEKYRISAAARLRAIKGDVGVL